MFEVRFMKKFLTGALKDMEVPVSIKYPTLEQALKIAFFLRLQPEFDTVEGTRALATHIQVSPLNSNEVVRSF